MYFDRDSDEFVGLDVQALMKSFPRVDVNRELQLMRAWLMSSKGKDRKGTTQFICRWLSKSPSDHIPASIPHAYLGELWKGNESLLAMNVLHP